MPPIPLEIPEIPYPAGLDAGAQAVAVDVRVAADGSVAEVSLISGIEPFASLVDAAARAARFTAATQDGIAVEVTVPITFEFPEPPIHIAGSIRRKGDRAPVADLTLLVGDRRVQTDAAGRFAVRNVAPGTWAIQVIDPSFHLPETVVERAPDERLDVDLWVAEASWAHEAVGVYRKRDRTAIRRTLTHDDIVAAPGAMGDPVRALQNEPGVVRTPLDTGWLLVRGGDPGDTAVFLDGVRVPLLYHLGGFTSVLHPEFVEQVRLYPGAPPAGTGRALSGAVEMELRRLTGDLHLSTGANLVFAHAYAEVPLGHSGGMAVAARRSYLDGVLALAVGPERAAISPRFWDWQMRYDSPRFGILLIGSSDAADAPTDVDEVAEVTQQAWQVQARGDIPTPGGTLRIQPWASWRVHTIVAPLREESATDWFPGLRVEWRAAQGSAVDTRVGVEAERHEYTIERDGDPRGAPYGFADPYAEIAFGDEVRARLGLRLTTLFAADQLPRAALSPRAELQWRTTPWLDLVGELGRYHQPPPSLYLLAFPEGPYLALERSEGGSVGARLRSGPVSLDVDVWLRRATEVAALERDGSMGALEGVAHGVETTLAVDHRGLRAQFIYQLTRSRFREEPGDGLTATLFDQPHRINAVIVQRLPQSWSLAGRWRFASGFATDPTEPIQAYDIFQQQSVDVGIDSFGRMAPYHALDLKASRRVTFRSWRLDVYLDVQNVYGRRIPEPTINGIDENIEAYGFGLPILPIFGVDGMFWP